MNKPFFSALDSPPFDFCIRKSHGFYSVRLLIFIQLFSSPHYIATGVPFLCATFEKIFICLSFGNLQDDFYEQVSIRYGLERGEVGSNKKHTTKYEWEKQRQEKELQALKEEIKPMQEYLRAFQDAIDGKKPFSKNELRKQIVGLIASYKQLEKEKAIKDKDNDFLFGELRKLEKKLPELERYKEYVDFIHTHAPDKLIEAKRTANERARAPKPPKNKNYQWTK